MFVLVQANSQAGDGRANRYASLITNRLRGAGCVVRELPTDRVQGRAAALAGIREGADALIVCGGDGSVHAAVQVLAGSSCALGVIPAGTGNDNARSLGVPTRDPLGAADAIIADLKAGGCQESDLARVWTSDDETALVLGVVSTGFDSSVNEWANTRSWPAGSAKYVVGMLRLLPSFRPLPYRLNADGVEHAGLGMLLCVGNGPSYGGGMRVCPTASRQDGYLDVMWLEAVPTLEFLRMFPRVYRGTHSQHPRVRTYRARSVAIAAPGQVAYGDGERLGSLPVRMEAWPGALRVVGARPPAGA